MGAVGAGAVRDSEFDFFFVVVVWRGGVFLTGICLIEYCFMDSCMHARV